MTDLKARNQFLANLTKGDTFTQNGAVSNSSTGSRLTDQFAKAGTFRGRELNEVFADQSALWGENPEMALRLPFYLRMITRKVKIKQETSTETVQRGQGNRDEALKRMLWIALYHPNTFNENMWLIPLVGSWRDLWKIMVLGYEAGLDKEKFFETLKAGLNEPSQKDLVLKYMPRIRSNSKCKSDWAIKTNNLAKEFSNYLGLSVKAYRKFKSTGLAHEFQQLISEGLFKKIDFNKIPGKALSMLASGDFLKKHKLVDKYTEWISKQPIAKFNGYVYELGRNLKLDLAKSYTLPLYKKLTYDKQFDNLIAVAKQDDGGLKGNVWCALDVSGSMTWPESKVAENTYALDVCLSLGIFFSTLNTGAFHKNVVAFSESSKAVQLSGDFVDMYQQVQRIGGYGSTNFLSVIDEMVRVHKQNPSIPFDEFPETILVVSDMQFNPSGSRDTNYQKALKKLREGGFPEKFVNNLKIIWWFCSGMKTNDYPSTIDDAGTYVFSGFDGAVISLLLGGDEVIDPETNEVKKLSMEEMVIKALSQELLLQLQLRD